MAVVAPDSRVAPQPVRPSSRPRATRRKALSERLTLNVVVGLVAGLLAFVLVAALLADRRDKTTVTVARTQIAAGTPITPDLVTSEAVASDTGFVGDLVTFDRIESGGLVATRTIQAGEPLIASAVGDAGSASPARVMSIPLDASQAANGQIQVGDQVDVIVSTRDQPSKYVLTAAPVVDRSSSGSGGGLVGGTQHADLVITVEVNSNQALELASAIESGTLTVVRSTGAPPVSSTTGEGGG